MRNPTTPRRTGVALAAVLSLVLAGCGGDSPSAPSPDDDPTDTDPGDDVEIGDPNGVLECEITGFPCSLAEVDLDVLERSDALGDEALAMLETGSSTAQVGGWLEGQEGMAEVVWDDSAVRFRLLGGRGVWVFREGAFVPGGDPDAVPPAANAAVQLPPPSRQVVAEDSEEKRALVLSPFAFEANDDGAAVAAILAATRGYEGRVTFLQNDTVTSTTVNVDSYRGWGGYQVIHVGTHGGVLCEDDGCRAIILAGIVPEGPGSVAERLKNLAAAGVSAARWEKYPELPFLIMTADFFRDEYGGGVEDAVIFINSCQSFGPLATDLADALQGSTSVFFGWDESVFDTDAKATATALYRELSEHGYPAEVAYDDLEELQFGSDGARLIMGKRPAGGDLRIREVVWVLDPRSEVVLTPSSEVAIDGIQGDGGPDAVPWLVRVDGVKPELAGDMQVNVSVDGVQADPVDLLEGIVDGEDRWTVSGVVSLPYDLEEDRRVSFEAWTNLHDDGESEHETPAMLVGEEPIMGLEWEMEATWVGSYTAAQPGHENSTPQIHTATLTMVFDDGQDAREPHPRYRLAGGTVTFDYNFRGPSGCTWSAPVLTFELTEEYIPRNPPAALVFNTTTTPVGYSGLIYTLGPEFEYTFACEDGYTSTDTLPASRLWFHLDPEDDRTVSPDRMTISDTYRIEGTYYLQETTYTIRRVR